MKAASDRLRIVHVVYRFDVGGLENVIVQLINRLPAERFEHVVLSLTTISDFKDRITQPGVRFIALDKPPGHAVPLYPRILRLLREIKPDVVHTCNLAALEIAPLAWLAGVPRRIHVEHGWDAHDPLGLVRKYRWLRRAYRPFVSHQVAVSSDLARYLSDAVGVPADGVSLIENGVDTQRFRPGPAPVLAGCPFQPGRHWLVGTVGRLQTVKNQPLLARAFVAMLRQRPELAERARLVIVGEGPLRPAVQDVLNEAGMGPLAWMPGARDDVAEVLRALDLFVLPSQAEGTSCTLQEAMATGLPVVATTVGAMAEAVRHEHTGVLVPPRDTGSLRAALDRLMRDPALRAQLGAAGLEYARAHFGLDRMLDAMEAVFRHVRKEQHACAA